MRFSSSVVPAFALGLAVALLPACHSPSGGWFPHATGSETFYSEEDSPKTITLFDTRTNEVLFTMDIPVGKQLTIDFEEGAGDDPVNTPDLLKYSVWEKGTWYGRLKNSLSVPNASSRRLEMTLRPGVEYAQAPKEAMLRTDQVADRPDWWTAKGGPLPEDTKSEMYDN